MLGKHQTNFQKKHQSNFMKENNPMENIQWGVDYEHPKGMLGKHQTEHQKEVARKSGTQATHGRKIMVIYRDGTVSTYKTIALGVKNLHVSGMWISKRLSDGLPYRFSKMVTSNVDNLKKLDGAMFKYIREDTEIID